MDLTKLLAVALAVFAEVEGDLKDGKLTVDEVLNVAKTVVDKLGYGDKAILNLGSGNSGINSIKKPIAGIPTN